MWSEIVYHYKDYIGSGIIMILYLACLVRLMVTEKRTERRILFVYLPLFVLFIFFLIPVAAFYNKYSDILTYFRFLWILPVSVTIAATITELVISTSGKKRIAIIVAAAFLIILGGKLVYTDEGYSVAENKYHVPQDVVELCDALELPGIQVYAAFPKDMLVYVRQYSYMLCMPYGYDIVKYDTYDYLSAMVEAEEVSAEALATEAHSREVYYIILDESHIIDGNMEDYDFEEYIRLNGYVVYKTLRIDYSEYL